MSRILVVRHHVEDDAGLVGEAFGARGFELTTEMLDASHPTPTLDGYDALIILGSNSSAYDADVLTGWFQRELTLMGEAVMRGVPIFGICFGAQALCVLNGGEVVPASEGELGWMHVNVVDGCPLPAGPWFQYHGDKCVVSDDTTVLATSPRAVQAFTFGKNLGVQFHPEIDDTQLARWFDSPSASDRPSPEQVRDLLDETRANTPTVRVHVAQLVEYFMDLSGLAP